MKIFHRLRFILCVVGVLHSVMYLEAKNIAKVPEPWTPIEVKVLDQGDFDLSVWGRTHQFRQSPLPAACPSAARIDRSLRTSFRHAYRGSSMRDREDS